MYWCFLISETCASRLIRATCAAVRSLLRSDKRSSTIASLPSSEIRPGMIPFSPSIEIQRRLGLRQVALDVDQFELQIALSFLILLPVLVTLLRLVGLNVSVSDFRRQFRARATSSEILTRLVSGIGVTLSRSRYSCTSPGWTPLLSS